MALGPRKGDAGWRHLRVVVSYSAGSGHMEPPLVGQHMSPTPEPPIHV